MIPQAGVGPPGALRIAAGRLLSWAPDWPCSEASVLFDAAAGDFWVLDGDSRRLIAALSAFGPRAPDALPDATGLTQQQVLALLEPLVRGGIIESCSPLLRPGAASA